MANLGGDTRSSIIASHSGSRLSSPSCFYGLKYRHSFSSLRLHTRANGFGPAAYGVFHRHLSGIQTVADKSPTNRRFLQFRQRLVFTCICHRHAGFVWPTGDYCLVGCFVANSCARTLIYLEPSSLLLCRRACAYTLCDTLLTKPTFCLNHTCSRYRAVVVL